MKNLNIIASSTPLSSVKDLTGYVDGMIGAVKAHETKGKNLFNETIPLVVAFAYQAKNPTRLNALRSVLNAGTRGDFDLFAQDMIAYQLRQIKGMPKIAKNKEFGKYDSAKAIEKNDRFDKFLTVNPETGKIDPENGFFGGDYMMWVELNIKKESKNKDWMKLALNAVGHALNPEKGNIDVETMRMELNALLQAAEDAQAETITEQADKEDGKLKAA